MEESIKLVGHGVDTLILNVRYADKQGQPVKQRLDEKLAATLDYLQNAARSAETAVASDWSFLDVLLFVEPHGAGKQWRWLLTCRLLSVAVSRGRFNDLIAQVRFSSEFLWSRQCTGDALYKVHDFLMGIFGEAIHLQVSEIHLCADVMGYDFSQCDYEALFVTRVRKNEAVFGVDSVSLNCHRVATLAFSKHKAPLSCAIYNKKLLATMHGHKWEALFTLALATGLRRGEILGLKWQDITFSTGKLQVRRVLSRVPTKMENREHVYVEAETKTQKSRRNVTIAPFALNALRDHRIRQLEAKLKAGPLWQEHDYVFCTLLGNHLGPNHIVEELKKLLLRKKSGNKRPQTASRAA
jgi:Phage integrase family